jgi:UDP-N-acetylmuramate dehydrogenase
LGGWRKVKEYLVSSMLKVQENITLASYTTLRVGGPARFFCETENGDEILEAVKFAKKKNIPIVVLGGGSNILVSDSGFEGLVIKIQNVKCEILNNNIDCGAGVLLNKVVNESIKAGLTGLEWAAGIPGTIGGAIRGNAGAFGGEIGDAAESVKMLDLNNLECKTFKREECKFEYRASIFKENPNLIIISAVLMLKKGSPEESEKKVKEIISMRKAAQPFDYPSSGSFFKNPTVKDMKIIEEYEKDTGKKIDKGVISAGYLIDALNLRGKKIGGAMVSKQHGNFLVNSGNATAEDFIILVSLIKQKVRTHFGIQLQEEVQLVGF